MIVAVFSNYVLFTFSQIMNLSLSIAQLIVQGSADGDVLGSPNLVGRFVEILKSLDFDEEEVDDFVDAAACEELHPSDEKWLDFCHRRINSPHK